jgi:hypothetical protein
MFRIDLALVNLDQPEQLRGVRMRKKNTEKGVTYLSMLSSASMMAKSLYLASWKASPNQATP